MTAEALIHSCLRDIDPEFLETTAITAAWEYRKLWDDLSTDLAVPADYKLEEFNRRRGSCAVRALCVAAEKHGVPYEFVTIRENGQRKLIVNCGRVLLIQEPLSAPSDPMRPSQYKKELADAHGVVRQLELDLGDRPNPPRDWSGCILGVLLHGPAGFDFTLEAAELSALFLGVPDAAYSHWVARLDLHEAAMFGMRWPDQAARSTENTSQPDLVTVTLKAKADKKQA